ASFFLPPPNRRPIARNGADNARTKPLPPFFFGESDFSDAVSASLLSTLSEVETVDQSKGPAVAIVSRSTTTKRTSNAISNVVIVRRNMFVSSLNLSAEEQVDQIENCRRKDDGENDWKQKPSKWNQELECSFLCGLFSSLSSLCAE